MHDRSIWKGLGSGLAGGLAGSWAMGRFLGLWMQMSAGSREGNGEEDSTVKTAARVSRALFGHELTEREKSIAAPAVHYAFGALTGGLYGAAAEFAPPVAAAGGAPFGAAVWLGAHEIAVPSLGLSKPPRETPLREHTAELAGHILYGITAESIRRLLRRFL